ncbi:MAG: HypC/HybG/HupF family hydrogenase formation chaperone [Acidobacteriota bacterium]|nr:HypC/HybG/HupF family hydrogenase formation chaperone [Acidobacteriota bacterium]
MCLGVPGQILDVDDTPLRMGRVAFGPTVKNVSLACVPDAGPGAWVVVHAGLALDQLDEEAARLMIDGLAQLELASGEAQA